MEFAELIEITIADARFLRTMVTSKNSQQDYEEYFAVEEELNRQLNVFAVNYSLVYGGNNTVAEQLGFPSQEGEMLAS